MNIFYFLVTRQVAAAIRPPRSVIIERFPPLRNKPRIIYVFRI
jgi:hypothetical protein